MKGIQSKGVVVLAALTAGVTMLLSGCGTTSGYQQADKTGAGIADLHNELVNGKKAIDGTMKTLGEIATTAATDPRKAFEQYSKAVANLESTSEKIRKRAEAMKAQGAAYFKQWETELSQVNNQDIRKLAETRKAKLQETFDNIRKYTEPLKTQFAPWMASLKDLQKYLSNDLTIAGVDAAKGLFTKASTEGLEVQKSMDALLAELNTVSATLTPAKVQPK